MPQEALDFIHSQRTGVIAVKMLDASPHAATVHFAYEHDSRTFLFLTTPTYRKLEPLRAGETAASFVIGTTEEVNKTL